MNTFDFTQYLVGGQYTTDGKLMVEDCFISTIIPTSYCTYDLVYHPKKELPHNCVNCGAPLHGDKCEYCGTEY